MSVQHIADFYFNTDGIFYRTENTYQGYIGAQKDLTQVTTLDKKSEAQPLSSTRQAEKVVEVNCELGSVTDSFMEQCM